jgi:hypothetical protein
MTIDERIEKIERQLVRLRWYNRCLIGFIVLSLGVWFVCMSFRPKTPWARSGAKVIRANNFILDDENGKPRATLDVFMDTPGLKLADENGKPRASLALTKLGPKLGLFDENGTPFWSAP